MISKELEDKFKQLQSKVGLAERKIIYLNIAIKSDSKMSTETRAQLKAIVADYSREMKNMRELIEDITK